MITLDRSYTCEDDEALARMQALAAYWDVTYGIKMQWSGTTATMQGKVMRVKFKGTVTVAGGHVHAEVEAGFLAEKLGAKKYVDRKVVEFLDPSLTLEELQARAK